MSLKRLFGSIPSDLDVIAKIVGFSNYKSLEESLTKPHRYRHFFITKKSGELRLISAPRKFIRTPQKILANAIEKNYTPHPQVFGFVKGRSICDGARQHVASKYILNIDLKDFFSSITYPRVRGLLKSYGCNDIAANIITNILCSQNALPQGSPASPIITNLICTRLDRELSAYCRKRHATYTRYADDITISFKRNIDAFVEKNESSLLPSKDLEALITGNGFQINPKKTRLHCPGGRYEVTGLTVNNKVNVRRSFIRKTLSMLYAWRKFGYIRAEAEFQEKYMTKISINFSNMIRGRIAYIGQVRGKSDPIFIKIANIFNEVSETKKPISISEVDKTAGFNHVWIIEDSESCNQGTCFLLDGVGIITCEHVIRDVNLKSLRIYTPYNKDIIFNITDVISCAHVDAAIIKIDLIGAHALGGGMSFDNRQARATGVSVRLLGYPSYSPGKGLHVAPTTISAGEFKRHGVNSFEIAQMIREGNSGGPVINDAGKVIGIAVEGASKDSGHNLVVDIREVLKLDHP